MHYCMGKLAEWGLGHNESKTCNKCGMEERENGCCKHEYKFIKNDTDQKTTESAFQLTHYIVSDLHPTVAEIVFNDLLSVTEINPINHAPPRKSSIAVYIRNCAFLI